MWRELIENTTELQIFTLVEADLRTLAVVVAVGRILILILFLAFSDLTCYLTVATNLMTVRRYILQVVNKRIFHQQVKIPVKL